MLNARRCCARSARRRLTICLRSFPKSIGSTRDLEIPRQMGESEIVDHFKAAAAKNANGYASFLGAGVYRHYRPVMIDAIVQRGEFLTSYTPYQAEITQGTLQAIFEFQTMICELTGMDIANASMYDGSTAAPGGRDDGDARDGTRWRGGGAHGASGVSRGDAHLRAASRGEFRAGGGGGWLRRGSGASIWPRSTRR